VATLCGAGQAAGPATTDSGAYVHWLAPEIELRPVAPPLPAGISTADFIRTLQRAAQEWNGALANCGAPSLNIGETIEQGGRIIQDDQSIVVMRDDDWCPGRAREQEDCYDPKIAGFTHLYPRHVPGSKHDGELREADIEINAVNFRWSTDGTPEGTHNLFALVVHELGHVLGLAHESATAPGYLLSIMYPSPVEAGRPPVLTPGDAEISQLCSLYSRPGRNTAEHRPGSASPLP
jgi:hypothetical protein